MNPVTLYLDDCRFVARLSPATVKGYATCLDYLSVYAGDPELLLIVTEDDLRKFFAWFAARPTRYDSPPSNRTVHAVHRALRTFFGWLVHHSLRADNPIKALRKPRVGKRLVPRLTLVDLKRLLDAAAGSHFSERNSAMLLVWMDCGLRVSELCGLRVEKVNLSRRVLSVIGKGDKEREVPFGKRTAHALELLIGDCLRGFVFLNHLNEPLQKRGAQRILSVLSKAAGLPPLTPHQLRHCMARLYVNKGDMRSLQLILGHAEISTTEIYTDLAIEDVQERFETAGVADRL